MNTTSTPPKRYHICLHLLLCTTSHHMSPARLGQGSQPHTSSSATPTEHNNSGGTHGDQLLRSGTAPSESQPPYDPNLLYDPDRMTLAGQGLRVRKRLWKHGRYEPLLPYNESGSGTVEDPTVAWQIDTDHYDNMESARRVAHVDEARKVAMELGLPCCNIRKEAHDKQYEPYTDGDRKARKLVDADLHLTVYTGTGPNRGLVEGHIYLVEVECPETGALTVRKMDNPAEQRSIVRPGLQPVAQEFWPTKRTRVHYKSDQQNSQQ